MSPRLTDQHAALLQKVDLFAGLRRMALAQLAAFVEAVTVEEGGVVFRQGEAGDALYIVAQGKFGVFASLPDAPTEARLSTLGPGDVFGEMALLTDEPRSATVRTDEGAGEVLRLERSRFFELIRREPALVQNIAATLTRRLQANARIILQSEHFIVSVVDQALARVPAGRRRQVLQASILDEITLETLAALFGEDAAEVGRILAECGAAAGGAAGPVLRLLRARMEREVGAQDNQAYAQEAADRLAQARLWPAALSLYARHAPRSGFVAALGRAARDPRISADDIAPWLERVADEEAAHDPEVALAKATLYRERGEDGPAGLLLQRALGAALSAQKATDARRLSDELASLTVAEGEQPLAALQYGLAPVRTRLTRPIGTRVLLVAAGVVLAGIGLLLPMTAAAKFLVLLGAAICLWVSEALPMAAVSLLLLASWLVAGVATAAQATAGFGSGNWLFVLALLGIAAAIARSGLLFRVGLLLIRRMPAGLLGQAGTLLLTGLLLGPLLPMAMGRVALTAPLALGVSQALRLRDREPAAAVLGLAAWIGAGPMLFTFLNASPACLLAWGLLPEASRQRFDWIHWLLAAAPLTLLIGIGSLAALFVVLRPARKAILAQDRLALQLAVLGPPSRRELAMGVILLLTVSGWLLAQRVGVDAATVALLGMLAAFVTGNLDRHSLREMDWNYLVFYGVALGLGGLTSSLGISKAVSEAIGATLTRLGVTPFVFVLMVAALSILLYLVIGEQAVLLLSLTFIPVAGLMGIDPWVVIISILSTVLIWLLPATTPEYLVAYSASEGRLFSHPQAQRVALVYTVVTLLALAAAVPYWQLIGLM